MKSKLQRSMILSVILVTSLLVSANACGTIVGKATREVGESVAEKGAREAGKRVASEGSQKLASQLTKAATEGQTLPAVKQVILDQDIAEKVNAVTNERTRQAALRFIQNNSRSASLEEAEVALEQSRPELVIVITDFLANEFDYLNLTPEQRRRIAEVVVAGVIGSAVNNQQ
ncbi:MAG: hypothetical protein AAFY41_16670 [Bacteroidota bacterium]